jgi:hypothetical protein
MAQQDPAARALQKQWNDAFKAACKRRKALHVSGEAFTVDEVYFTTLNPTVWLPDGNEVKVTWNITIKPMAVDDILRRAFMPDLRMGPRMQLNRRVNGAFQVRPWTIGEGVFETPKTSDPEQHWSELLDEFGRIRGAFIDAHPTAADYLRVIRTAPHPERSHNRLREITALIAAGLTEEAAAVADAELAAGEHGPMWSGAGVFEYLSAYAKGPDTWMAFLASLVPTHDLELIAETSRSFRVGLSRARDAGRFLDYLGGFDGTDVWALILGVRLAPAFANDQAAVRYLQAAGTAEAMTVEIRRPGGREWGAVSVRSVIGRPHFEPAALTVAVELPRSTQMVSTYETFGAEEAAALFDHFYRTDDIPAHYALRPVESWGADGAYLATGDS